MIIGYKRIDSTCNPEIAGGSADEYQRLIDAYYLLVAYDLSQYHRTEEHPAETEYLVKLQTADPGKRRYFQP